MIKKALTTLVILLVLVNISCQERYPDLEDGIYAEIETNKGTMVAKLFYDKVPVTVANFVALAEGNHPMAEEKYKGKPFYDSITFHRVMDQFMIQGGDPTATGSGTPGYRFTADFSPDLKHDKPGILSMANSGGLNTNGSQFFITERPYPRGDAFDAQGNMKPCERNGVSCHSVFGELVKGLEVQDSISNVKVAARNKPVEDVIITKLNIIRKGKDAKFFNAPKIFQEEMPKVEENLNKIKDNTQRFCGSKDVEQILNYKPIYKLDIGLRETIEKSTKINQESYNQMSKNAINFAKENFSPDSHYNYARCEIHLPPCIPGEGQEFSVNTSKTEVDLGRTIEERLKKWSDKPQSKWHSKDPIKTSLSKRAQLRLGEDKGWKKCSYCEENSIPGADTHKFADCPHRPTCEFCGKKSHGGRNVPLTREYCPKVKPCGKCGSKAHDTSNHVDVPIITPVPKPGPTPIPSPNPDPPLTSTFPVSYTNKGPLISSKDSESGGLPILNINEKHPYYATLKELLGA